MVKFGKHIDLFVEHDNVGTGLYVVSYNDLKEIVTADTTTSADTTTASNGKIRREKFMNEWLHQLNKASENFELAISDFWTNIFTKIDTIDGARGALPGVAITLYSQLVGREATRELLVRLKQIHDAAYHNTEALRKIVKKFDKNYQNEQSETLSSNLLPKVYTACFSLAQPTLEEGMALVRDLLEHSRTKTAYHQNSTFDDESGYESDKSNHDHIVEDRQAELDWLTRLTGSMQEEELACLVAHRGFHNVQDFVHRRPVENSLSAYETAWTNGIHLCECDIALTKDEKLVLAHDEDFSRLALNKKSASSYKKVQDLTFKELIALQLTSATRPPLLIDVLRSADAIGDNAKLVIEIKPGNEAAATALAQLLSANREFLPRVAVIMSFDAYTMHQLRRELTVILSATSSNPLGHRRNRSSRISFSSGLTDLATSPGLFGVNRIDGPLGSFSLGEPAMSFTNSPALGPLTESMPQLMLLTVADPPKKPCELQVSVNNLSLVDSWLVSGDSMLDGVYLQYQPEMLEPDGLASLQKLSNKYSVGVWTHSLKDPDDYNTFHKLVHEGKVNFVNTDLPESFRNDLVARQRVKKSSTGASRQ